MSRKGGAKLDVPTACRFAVLEVSDDSEEDENPTTLSKKTAKTTSGKNDSSSASSKKKKQKKRKHKSKTTQADVLEEIEAPSHSTSSEINTEKPEGDWQSWQNRDEQFVLEQFQKDLKAALEASKVTNYSKDIHQENDLSSNKKKKKEKTISLDEFISGNTETGHHQPLETNGTTSGFPADNTLYGLDDFQICNNDNIPVSIPMLDEKPQKTKKKKKGHEKSVDEESIKKESDHKEHKIISASHEESIKAEMVHIQEELTKKDGLVGKLQNTIEKQKGWISELQKELAQVKKRNKQLCHILGQGEMKEKADLLLQIEELSEVREQVVQLHAELEQERSKSSALKQELVKHQTSHGRPRHGSTS